MSKFNYKNFVGFLNGEIFEDIEKESQNKAPELADFTYSTNSYMEIIEYMGIPIYHSENSDRGWDDEKDDYERTIPEQVLLGLKELQEDITKVVKIVEESI